MICVYCFNSKTAITNSRGHKKEAATWRRHACPNCGKLFSSLERPVMSDTYSVSDEVAGTTEAYSRSRLSTSLIRSFGHLPGAAVYRIADDLVDTIEARIITAAYLGQLSKDELGALTWDVVKRFDAVAGVQYAAQNGLIDSVKKRPGRPGLL